MNKVFIRTRQIDNNKQLPILLKENDDLTDFNEYSNISKSSQILSGMDKGEESEHHLQEVLRELQYDKAIFNKAIPIPEVIEEPSYDVLYKSDFKLPKNYIRLKTLDFEDELPEYDLDEEDKEWLENSRLNVTSLKFEQIIEQFEKACCQKALLLDEAKSLLRYEAVHLVIAIYDYWLTKRVNTGQTLILSVKAEKVERCNNTPIDPYIAFRKRSEKMTTRKNRRVDEASYEKMFRLRQQMEKLSEIIQLVSQREATKSQITQNERDLFMKRYDARDYDKLQLKESEITVKRQSFKASDNFKSSQRSREENQKEPKRKRSYSKTFDSNQSSNEHPSEDIDFTFRPMSKCKYLPSRLTLNNNNSSTSTIDNNNNSYFTNQSSVYDPKSFSLSKLSHLPEPLCKLNTPVRLRWNSNRMLSVDLQLNPMNESQSHANNVVPPNNHSCAETVDFQSCHANNNDKNYFNPMMLSSQESKPTSQLMQKLLTLYNRNIHCGLPPLNFYPPADIGANIKHISLSSLSSSNTRTNDPTNVSVHNVSANQRPVTITCSVSNSNSNSSSNNSNHYHQNNQNFQQQHLQDNHNHNGVTNHYCHNKTIEQRDRLLQPAQINTDSSNHRANRKSTVSLNHHHIHNNNNDQQLSSSKSHSKSSLSLTFSSTSSISPNFLSNHNGGTTLNIFTYQNNNSSYSNSDNGGNNGCSTVGINNNSKNGSLMESDRKMKSNGQLQQNNHSQQQKEQYQQQVNPHRKSTTTATKDKKDLVESQSTNHSSLNGSGGGGFKNQLSKVGLNCLKSLTKKRVIPRNDINEMASFYSKSNGHQHGSWLNQNTSDSCLTSNLLPLWKSEPHVMTSVNKMT